MIAATQAFSGIQDIEPKKLKPHPLNVAVYGEMNDPDFVDSCKSGIREPIVCTRDFTVVSGHRRLEAAILHGHSTVPCLVRDDLAGDSPIVEFELLLANKQRRKTQEQIAREVANLLRIQQLLNTAQKPGPKKVDLADSGMKSTTISEKPSSANIAAVADAVGIGVQKAKRAVRVVEAIDEAHESGDTETADLLRETLNTKSVAAANKQVSAKKRPTKKSAADPFAKLEKSFGQLRRLVDETANAQGGKGVHYEAVDKCMGKLYAAIVKWKQE